MIDLCKYDVIRSVLRLADYSKIKGCRKTHPEFTETCNSRCLHSRKG